MCGQKETIKCTVIWSHCRSQEDVASLKRKLEKYKSREWMAAGDEVLLEEIKMYRVCEWGERESVQRVNVVCLFNRPS